MLRSTWLSAAKCTIARGLVGGEQSIEQRAIADVALHEDVARSLPQAREVSRFPA